MLRERLRARQRPQQDQRHSVPHGGGGQGSEHMGGPERSLWSELGAKRGRPAGRIRLLTEQLDSHGKEFVFNAKCDLKPWDSSHLGEV